VRVAGPAATEYVCVAFAPDGGSVYYLTLDHDKGDTALYRAPLLGGPSSMAAYDVGPVGFSPDGRQIAFIRMYRDESRPIVAGIDGSAERALATRRKPELFRLEWNAPAWSPDGKTIACQGRLSDERRLYETVVGVDVGDGSERTLTSARWSHAGQPVWLADGSGLLVTASARATSPEQVWYISVAGGEARRVTHDLDDYHDLSLTRDSSRIAAVQDHTVSGIWVLPEADAGRARRFDFPLTVTSRFVRWSPDGKSVAYANSPGGLADIWLQPLDGSQPKRLTDFRAEQIIAFDWSRDGRSLAFVRSVETSDVTVIGEATPK
jgi:Tol biopolymer transport system component